MYSSPIPESSDLPPSLDDALGRLIDPMGPAETYVVLPDPESVTEARHFTLSRLAAWGVPGLGDDVGLVVSELVTNALRHGGTPLVSPLTPPPVPPPAPLGRVHRGFADPLRPAPAVIQLRLLRRFPWLLCGITDASPAAPRRKEPDYIAETGRGLHLVESFTTRWGWRGLPTGKVVWALFHAP
ncbi:ATP-binding protein [Actinomadura atramentaria]|uniref:ATP-binding protein n=1 Tax=Actinomadura atramentaria TaxID=1990 RepID=UPI0003A1CDA5|nr:ATP-binding protein [Actinomadura atramentaria]